ncbi:hypothetical protein OH492_04230 [Vibrio chagasii]|nr:hypothetical protein [Vibrio chagasii]
MKIGFNSLGQYLGRIKPSDFARHLEEFAEIGVKADGEYRQSTATYCKFEKLLCRTYSSLSVAKSGEKLIQRTGRMCWSTSRFALDVNRPAQLVSLSSKFASDLFLTWSVLTDSAEMDNCELECWRDNWKQGDSGRSSSWFRTANWLSRVSDCPARGLG